MAFPLIISTISALFSKPRTMEVDGLDLLLSPTAKYNTDTFLYFLLAEAIRAKSDPHAEVLDRFIVDKVRHDKIPRSPEHEIIIIDTHDTKDNNKKRQFILERMVSKEALKHTNTTPKVEIDIHEAETNPNPFTSTLFEKVKQIVEAMFAALTSDSVSDDLSSMEAGCSYKFSPSPSAEPTRSASAESIDSVTVSASESAEAVSEAISDCLNTKTPAIDRFLGGHFVTLDPWHGDNMQSFKPNRLTLFEFVLLAHVVHKQYPNYTQLGKHCFFFASLVYDAALRYGGVRPSNETDADRADDRGRWNGMKVSKVDPRAVSRIVTKFKSVLAKQTVEVSVCLFELFSVTDTIYIDQSSVSEEFEI